MIDLLQDENIEPEIRKKFLNNINNELEKTQWLIVMLLKHSKIDSGTVVIKNNKINLADVIKEALSSFLVQADMRNIAINTNINDSFIEGDYNWSVEAFENIIKNCIEHMENGGKLDITCVQTSIYSKVVIKDNGCGIDKEDLPHIFERFYRGKNSSKDSVGIGLSLSKAIISREKGTIDVTSEINVGTTFSIKFYSSIV